MAAYYTTNCTDSTGGCTWTAVVTYTTGTTTSNGGVVYVPITDWYYDEKHHNGGNGQQQYQHETAQQRQAREDREAEERARWAQVERDNKKARETATEKGDKLLKDVLGDEAYALFKQQGYVDIPSVKDANKRYRIRSQRRIGIVKFENGQWVEKALSLCIHPPNSWNWVEGDLLATHVLLAKFNEPDLERVANLHSMAA